jgi:hypothetical protein
VKVVEKPAVPLIPVVEEKTEMVKAFKTPEPSLKKPMNGKLGMHSCESTDSLASASSSSSRFVSRSKNLQSLLLTRNSATAFDDSIQELWLLRRNEAKRKLKRSIAFFGVQWYASHSYVPESFYLKPLPSCASDIALTVTESRGSASHSQHLANLKKKVLKMPDEAQWEIQKLIESRETASSNENVRREWEVVGFTERPRRKITPETRKWWKGGKKGLVEWVIVIRGETVDRKNRVMPCKHEDPWNPKPKPQGTVANPTPAAVAVTPTPVAAPAPVQLQTQIRTQTQVPAGTVLRHVENRRVMTAEEAERKMDEIVRDLFRRESAHSSPC